MEKFRIHDKWVHFPYVPYPAQETFMGKVLESLNSGKNALLESPTGTGKTMCLLCSSLAWLDMEKRFKDIPDLRLLNESDPISDNNISSEQISESVLKSYKNYKIFFCTRTHSQIMQAIDEFRNTGYQHLRSTVLASRRHLCIHPCAIGAEDNLDKKCRTLRKTSDTKIKEDALDPGMVPDIEDLPVPTSKCKKTKKDDECLHGCPFYENFVNMKKKGKDVLFTKAGAFDQISLIEKCKKYNVCPFYMSRHLEKWADITFLPYSYIFNPHILRGLKINLRDAIIIIDEGHNIEGVCEENASFEMTIQDVKNCIDELGEKELRKAIWEEAQKYPPKTELTDKKLSELEKVMMKLKSKLNDVELDKGEDGEFCLSLFSDAGFTETDWFRLLADLNEVTQLRGQKELVNKGLRKMCNVISSLFYLDSDDFNGSQESTLKKSYVFCKTVVEDKTENEQTGVLIPKPETKPTEPEPKIFLWCFDAGVVMQSLQGKGVHSFIVTSGTLSPFAPLRKGLAIPFEIELKNKHVIDKSQVLALCIDTVNMVQLLGTHRYRKFNKERLYEAYGKLVLEVAKVSPKGQLIFFSSTKIKNECTEIWGKIPSENSDCMLLDEIMNMKQIYQEPKLASQLPALQKVFSNQIADPENHGACLMGVLNGKVSEGIDFKDDLGRAVIMFGIPCPPIKDPRVNNKMEHIRSRNGKPAEDDWYLSQSMRPVNQALGRIIRHQGDYGVVILADSRYKEYRYFKSLPHWLQAAREEVRFCNLDKRLQEFFGTIPSKIIKIKKRVEEEKEMIREKHRGEWKKEEYPSDSFHTVSSLIKAENVRKDTLFSEIIKLSGKIEEAKTDTTELNCKINRIKGSIDAKDSTIASEYDSDCESTGEGEWNKAVCLKRKKE